MISGAMEQVAPDGRIDRWRNAMPLKVEFILQANTVMTRIDRARKMSGARGIRKRAVAPLPRRL